MRGGWKFQDGCNNISVDHAIFNGVSQTSDLKSDPTGYNQYENYTYNSGFKVQVSAVSASNITVNELVVRNALGGGIYLFGNNSGVTVSQVTVHSYTGTSNCQNENHSDVMFDNYSSGKVDQLASHDAGSTGVWLAASCLGAQIGSCLIDNSIERSSVSDGVEIAASGTTLIKDLFVRDTSQPTSGFFGIRYGLHVDTNASSANTKVMVLNEQATTSTPYGLQALTYASGGASITGIVGP